MNPSPRESEHESVAEGQVRRLFGGTNLVVLRERRGRSGQNIGRWWVILRDSPYFPEVWGRREIERCRLVGQISDDALVADWEMETQQRCYDDIRAGRDPLTQKPRA